MMSGWDEKERKFDDVSLRQESDRNHDNVSLKQESDRNHDNVSLRQESNACDVTDKKYFATHMFWLWSWCH